MASRGPCLLAGQALSAGSAWHYTLPADMLAPAGGQALTLSASQADGSALPGWLSFKAASGTFSGTAAQGDVGQLALTVTARDAAGASAQAVLQLHIGVDPERPVHVERSYTLAPDARALVLDGSAPIDGTGNSLANQLTGNSAANVLRGLAGNDTYVFNLGGGADTLIDHDTTSANRDTLLLGAGMAPEATEVVRVGHDMVLRWAGNARDSVTIQDVFAWSMGRPQALIESVKFANGTTWGVSTLLQHLAQATPPAAGAALNVPDTTVTIDAIYAGGAGGAGGGEVTVSATLSRPLAAMVGPEESVGAVVTGTPMRISTNSAPSDSVPYLVLGDQPMVIDGGLGNDAVYVGPGAWVDARLLGGGNDRIHFTGQLNDYTQAIDQDTGIYSFTHKSRPAEVVWLTSMGEDDVLYFKDGHIVFNAVDDTRLYDESGAGFASVDASWLSPGGTPLMTEKLEYSADGGASWQDVSGSVTGTAVSLSDPALTSDSTVRLRVANQGASGAEAAQQVSGPGDDPLEVTAAELGGLAGPAGVRYNGWGGEDTPALRCDQSGVLMDFTAFASNAFQGIERVDISGAGSNTARLGLAQLLGPPDEDQSRLIVLGDADDSVQLVGGPASWLSQGSLHWQASDFEVYAHGGAPERSLLLQQGMAMFMM